METQTETLREFAARVDATIGSWSDEKLTKNFRAAARFNGAKEDLFWAHDGIASLDEIKMHEAAVRKFGNEVLAR